VYLLVEALAPAGAGTRAFAWLVTANNGGMALGAALAGGVIGGHGGSAGLWAATACALAGVPVALAGAVAGSRADVVRPSRGSAP
jgi:hypothetical protein